MPRETRARGPGHRGRAAQDARSVGRVRATRAGEQGSGGRARGLLAGAERRGRRATAARWRVGGGDAELGAWEESVDKTNHRHPKYKTYLSLVALQVKGSIPIFSLLQQQDLKDNTLCEWVSRREDTQIWVMPLLIPKMDFLYGYSVGGYRYCVGNVFWVWVPK